MEHFGIKLINRGKSFYLNRDEFALINTKPSLPYYETLANKNAYTDKDGSEYTESWCDEYRQLCLKNYDLNIAYFSKLDESTFDEALRNFLSQYKQFIEVKNLNEFTGIEGYYIMVLGQYKQVYIGKTTDIKKRITQHWSKTRQFDRTLFPMYAWDKSCFSIDFFRPLDTTKIYVWKNKTSIGIESELINNFPSQFCTNRIGGDITDAIKAISTTKERILL